MKKRVLFLCPGNACNSQMAEGMLKHFYKDEFDVFSAGLNPIGIDKSVIDVMKEIGIDITDQTSKHLNDLINKEFDIIITFCSDSQESSHPVFLSAAQKYNWDFFDPSEQLWTQKDLLKALREVRDGIKEKILEHFKTH